MAVRAHFKAERDEEGRPLEYHIGIPARDLTDEDWEALSDGERDLVLASSLYNVSGVADSTERERGRYVRRVERASENPADADAQPVGEDR